MSNYDTALTAEAKAIAAGVTTPVGTAVPGDIYLAGLIRQSGIIAINPRLFGGIARDYARANGGRCIWDPEAIVAFYEGQLAAFNARLASNAAN